MNLGDYQILNTQIFRSAYPSQWFRYDNLGILKIQKFCFEAFVTENDQKFKILLVI